VTHALARTLYNQSIENYNVVYLYVYLHNVFLNPTVNNILLAFQNKGSKYRLYMFLDYARCIKVLIICL